MTCNIIIPTVAAFPTISVAAPLAITYDVATTTQMPDVTVGTSASPDTVTVTYTLGRGDVKKGGCGSIDSTVSAPPGVTITPFDDATKTYIVAGPVADVNTVLAGVQYTSGASEKALIPYDVKVTDSASKTTKFCDPSLLLAPIGVLFPFTSACTETLTLTGTTGTVALTGVDEVAVTKEVLTSAPVAFNTNLTTTVGDLVTNINGNATMFTAEDLGSGTFKICALESLGETANCWNITTAFTGDLGLTGTTKFSEGVTGKVNPKTAQKQAGDSLFDKALNFAGDIVGPLALVALSLLSRPTSGMKLTVRRDEDNPIREVKLYLKAFDEFRFPDIYNPTTRVMSDTFAAWKAGGFTFDEGFTDNPAWVLLWLIQDTTFGLGNIIKITTDELAILYEDIFNASLRNDEDIDVGPGSETRNTINGTVFNTLTNLEVMNNIASVMQSRPVFDDGLRVIQDRPGTVKAIFNETNVLNTEESPGFTYTGNSMKIDFNTVTVSWFDPNLPCTLKSDTVSAVVTVNSNQTRQVIGWGINQLGQALRLAKKIIIDEAIADPNTVTFVTGVFGETITIGDVVRITDRYNPNLASTDTNAGRILEQLSTTQFRINDTTAITGTPSVYIVLPDGTLHTSTVTTFVDNGPDATITITDAVPSTPVEKAWYNIGDGELYKIFRKQERPNGIEYEFTGILHSESKYGLIDATLVDA